jgi:hypothetical protein
MNDITLAGPGLPPGTESPSTGLLRLDSKQCSRDIGFREFDVSHALRGHPSFTLDALAGLADSLPPKAVERHAADQPLLVPGGQEHLPTKPSDTVRNIRTNGSWMVMWNLEQNESYRRIIDAVLDQAAPLLPRREAGMGRREAFLFISSPNSVTPVHFDPEHNFLLQISGIKQIGIGKFPDRASEIRALDRYYDGSHRNLDSVPPTSSAHVMNPGDGVYVYPWAPHWVHNGPEPSVSLSLTFRTGRSQRIENACMFNRKLRIHGLRPHPAGEFEPLDRAKAAAVAFTGWVRRGGHRQLGIRDYS